MKKIAFLTAAALVSTTSLATPAFAQVAPPANVKIAADNQCQTFKGSNDSVEAVNFSAGVPTAPTEVAGTRVYDESTRAGVGDYTVTRLSVSPPFQHSSSGNYHQSVQLSGWNYLNSSANYTASTSSTTTYTFDCQGTKAGAPTGCSHPQWGTNNGPATCPPGHETGGQPVKTTVAFSQTYDDPIVTPNQGPFTDNSTGVAYTDQSKATTVLEAACNWVSRLKSTGGEWKTVNGAIGCSSLPAPTA